MGYFDGLAEAAFKKDAVGNTVFYPWGVLGAGFVVPTEEEGERIRAFTVRSMTVSITTIIAIQVLVGVWLNLIIFPFYAVWYYFAVKRITSDLPATNERLGLAESYRNSARAHNLPTLVLLAVFSVIFVAGGVFLLSTKQHQVLALFSIAFFGLAAIAIGYMILVKIGNR